MHRNLFLIAATLFLAALVPGCSSMKSESRDLTALLTKQLGITESQASGGVGAILQLAKEKLNADQFDTVAKAIPGSQKYLDAAKQVLGEGKVGNANGLQSTFSELGMGPDTLAKFKTLVTNYAGEVGGPQAKILLENALK